MEICRFEVLSLFYVFKLRLVYFLAKLLKYFQVIWTVSSVQILIFQNSFKFLIQIGQVITGIIFKKWILKTAVIFKVLNKRIDLIIFHYIFSFDPLVNYVTNSMFQCFIRVNMRRLYLRLNFHNIKWIHWRGFIKIVWLILLKTIWKLFLLYFLDLFQCCLFITD